MIVFADTASVICVPLAYKHQPKIKARFKSEQLTLPLDFRQTYINARHDPTYDYGYIDEFRCFVNDRLSVRITILWKPYHHRILFNDELMVILKAAAVTALQNIHFRK